MKDWGIATNDYWYTASVFLEDKPWYLFALERTVMFVCDMLSVLDFIKFRKEWDIQSLFHVLICCRVTDFVYKRTNSRHIDLPYFFLKKEFPSFFDEKGMCVDENNEEVENNKKMAKVLDKQFKDAYTVIVKDWSKRPLKRLEERRRKNEI